MVNTNDFLLLVIVDLIYFIVFPIYKQFINVKSFKFLKKKQFIFYSFLEKNDIPYWTKESDYW